MKVLGANGLQYLITKLMGVDFIVEEGTSGIWTYRKWNSGIAECWGEWSGTLTNYATPMANLYGYYTSVYYPFTFVAKPTVTYTAGCSNVFAWSGAVTDSAIQTSYANLYCAAVVSGSQSIRFEISIKGRWK